MEAISFALVLYVNVVVFIFLYVFIQRYRRLVGFHLGMNISMVTGGLIALTTGILLIFQYPFHFTIITVIATLAGMAGGAIFGALFDYQTMLTGLVNGLMVGIMAPMLGAILTEKFFFMIALEVIICILVIIVIHSIRRS